MDQMKFKKLGIAIFVTAVTIFATKSMAGGSNGGGGFEFPNSRLMLEKVSKDLIRDIEFTNEGTFANFSEGLNSKAEILRILTNIVSMPDEITTRPNGRGQREGLMFDYDGGRKTLFVKRPFFAAYSSLAMKQVPTDIPWRELYSHPYFPAIVDVRERLVHELGHLMKIGVKEDGTDDSQADVFAKRFESALEHQLIYCESHQLVNDDRLRDPFLFNFAINPATGKYASLGVSTKNRSPEEAEFLLKKFRSLALRYAAKDKYAGDSWIYSMSGNERPRIATAVATESSLIGNKYFLRSIKFPALIQTAETDNLTIDMESGRGQFNGYLKDWNLQGTRSLVTLPLNHCRWKITPIEINDLVTR